MPSLRSFALLALALFLAAAPLPASQESADQRYSFLARLHERGLHELAVESAREFLRQHPGDARAPSARLVLGASLLELEQPAAAAGELRPLAHDPRFEKRADAALRLARCELELGALDPAREAARLALASPEPALRAPSLLVAAEIELAAGAFPRAAELFRELQELAPDREHSALARRGLAWSELRAGRPERAAEQVRAFLAAEPAHALAAELCFLAGECELAAGRPRAALERWRACEGEAYAELVLRGRALAHSALGELEAAATAFGQLLERFPNGPYAAEAALQQGAHLLRAGKPSDALAALSSPAAGKSAELLAWRARAERALGLREIALASAGEALALSPEPPLASSLRSLQAELLLALGREEEALAAFRAAGTVEARTQAALLELRAGRFESAAREAAELLAEAPAAPLQSQLRLVLGEALFALERFDEAIAAFAPLASAGEEVPAAERARALSRAAWCRYRSADPAEAAALFGALVERHPKSAEAEEALFLQARALHECGRNEEARRVLARYLALHPGGPRRPEALLLDALLGGAAAPLESLLRECADSEHAPRARLELARLREEQGELEAAANHYRALLEQHPEHALAPEARYGLGWCLHRQGSAAAALEALEPLLRSPPATELELAAHELALWAARDGGAIERCASLWRALAAQGRDPSRAYRAARVAAHALESAGRPEEARLLLGELLQLDLEPHERLGTRLELGWIELRAARLAEAARELEAARASPALAEQRAALDELCFFLAEAHFGARDFRAAAELYGRCAESALAAEAHYKRGFALLELGEPQAAAAAFAQVLERGPEEALAGESLYLCGEALFRAGRFEEALAPLERCLAQFPRHEVRAKALFRAGLALLELGRFAAAGERLAELLRTKPDFELASEAELGRARAWVELGDARGARAAYERVLAREQGLLAARARLGLAQLALSAGDHERALSEYLKVALLHAPSAEVAEALYGAGRCLEAQGRRELARRQYDELVREHASSPFAQLAQERIASW